MCKILDDFMNIKMKDDAIILHDVVDSLFDGNGRFGGLSVGNVVFNDDTAVFDIWDDDIVDGFRAYTLLGTITVDVDGNVIASTIDRSVLTDVAKYAGVTLCC